MLKVVLVGRPNVGKSSLLNKIIGHPISITSKKRQTTRDRILGVFSKKNAQFVFVDTPGIESTGRFERNRKLNSLAIMNLKKTYNRKKVALIGAGRWGYNILNTLNYIQELDLINNQCLRINDYLQGLFRGIGIKLVDFKVEFGKTKSNETIILADEISPDTCRLWDQETDKKLDKDRFRKDLGNIVEAYQDVARRLGILHEQSNIRPIKFSKPTAVKIKKNK